MFAGWSGEDRRRECPVKSKREILYETCCCVMYGMLGFEREGWKQTGRSGRYLTRMLRDGCVWDDWKLVKKIRNECMRGGSLGVAGCSWRNDGEEGLLWYGRVERRMKVGRRKSGKKNCLFLIEIESPWRFTSGRASAVRFVPFIKRPCSPSSLAKDPRLAPNTIPHRNNIETFATDIVLAGRIQNRKRWFSVRFRNVRLWQVVLLLIIITLWITIV